LTLSLREMDIFRRVMELGSITAAAAALNISQPAASRLLQQAEERLGFPLFRREKKGCGLQLTRSCAILDLAAAGPDERSSSAPPIIVGRCM
jgi:DNA-binding transcriptional LysR family regulator